MVAQFIVLFQAAAPGGAGTMNLIFMGLLFAVMYFFMIRPQQKKQKEQQVFADAIQKGDQVVTASGLHGKVMKVEGDLVTLEAAKGVYVVYEKSAINKDLSEKARGSKNATTTTTTAKEE